MLTSTIVFVVAGLYLGGLFLLAFVTDRKAERGTANFINSPVVYTLSLAVYCTSWTFYGAVGSAARNGLEYLTIYLGPTLVLIGWWFLLRKLVRISKAQRITSIADFISARYGKSAWLSALVTLIALIGVTPYIALQLKAVAASFDALVATDELLPGLVRDRSLFHDTGLWVAACMAVFVILFGSRNLVADERHPGVVSAIAFESIVKLFSLGAIALFAVYGLHDGVADLFAQAEWHAGVKRLYGFADGFEPRWIALTFLSAAAIMCLPRQFQVTVLENHNEHQLATAAWLFPLYMFLVSIFVIPIAISGMTKLPETANPDLYVLHLPLDAGYGSLALLAFVGGLSAATSMVIVASIALSIMISNHLVTPVLLRLPFFTGPDRGDFSKVLLVVRRVSIVAILTLGFSYYHLTGTASPLASIGLISFVGVAQFLPALIGGIYWERGTKAGATTGLLGGFFLWVYTLMVPSLGGSGWAFMDLVRDGPLGIAFLRPAALFGTEGWDPIVHGLVWSMTANITLYALVSILTRQSPLERLQSAVFVDIFHRRRQRVEEALQRSATTDDLFQLSQRILGPERARRIFLDYGLLPGGRTGHLQTPGPDFVAHVERQIASSVGAASARSLVARIAKGEIISLDAVINILDETQEAIRYSRELERKSKELEETAAQLRRANAQLTRMDRLKDDFLSRVSHELRTPMTSICSFSEILAGEQVLDSQQTRRFVHIIQQESRRLTRLLDEILDLNRLESGRLEWDLRTVDAAQVVREAMETMRGLARNNAVALEDRMGARSLPVTADADRLKQVFINLLSNAIKFNSTDNPAAWVEIADAADGGLLEIRIRDNGPGIAPEDQARLFDKFARGWNTRSRRSDGAGLGLAISRQIMLNLGGDLTLASSSDKGSCFAVTLRRADADVPAVAE
ncbi:MAG: sodium:solute symporter [Rhodobacterales bacterium]|nr:sodium:solute symporter [Rhodobacterales bacterium]